VKEVDRSTATGPGSLKRVAFAVFEDRDAEIYCHVLGISAGGGH
jgi:hypothetical protein